MTDIRISPEFKTATTKAIAGLLLFVIAYLLIVVAAFAVAVLGVYAGFLLIISGPSFITIFVGLGIASFGILILIFAVKFIFTSNTIDRSHLIEIKYDEAPKLFNMIGEISKQVDTSFPGKVFLSSDVNASVFYHSSFWSMFFPVKKHLHIGLGLINSVTEQELKAILSHEFGHFGQKTMRVGSYVYNVNRIIFNMLYDNDGFERLVENWSSTNGIISLFIYLAIGIIRGIQFLLRKLYDVVNLSYLNLSREMEFQADQMAASVTGYQPLKTSLLRLSLAEDSLSHVLGFHFGRKQEKTKTVNVFKEQEAVMRFLAKENNLPLTNGFPEVSIKDEKKYNKSKLEIKDQWASHPSMEERILKLENSGYHASTASDEPANTLLADVTKWQNLFSKKIFDDNQTSPETKLISSEEFITTFEKEYADNSFPKVYKGYYDYKNPFLSLETIEKMSENDKAVEDFFSDEKIDWVYTSIGLKNDIEILKSIQNRSINIRTFDYDGKKYDITRIPGLLAELDIQYKEVEDKIKANDISIFNHCIQLDNSSNGQGKLKSLYETLSAYDSEFEQKYALFNELNSALQFINDVTPFEVIEKNFRNIVPLEVKLREAWRSLFQDPIYEQNIEEEGKAQIVKYVDNVIEYFNGSYNDEGLSLLIYSLNTYADILGIKYFNIKRELLTYQADLLTHHLS